MKSKFKLLIFALLSIFTLSSCDENVTITSRYVYVFSEFSSSDAVFDAKLVTDYMKEIGILIDESFPINGSSSFANDKAAIAAFEAAVVRISPTDISELGISSDTNFTLAIRGSGTDPAQDEYLDTYSYPQN